LSDRKNADRNADIETDPQAQARTLHASYVAYFFFLVFDARLRGTLAPERRACDSPIAIACLRLLTFLPDRPLLSVPRLRSCIARFTLRCAFLPYFLAIAASSLFRLSQESHPFGGGGGSDGGGCWLGGSESDIEGSGSSGGNVSVESAGVAVSSGSGTGASTAGAGPVSAAGSFWLAPQPARITEPKASTESVLSVFIFMAPFLRPTE
jgi:hypothetical protein